MCKWWFACNSSNYVCILSCIHMKLVCVQCTFSICKLYTLPSMRVNCTPQYLCIAWLKQRMHLSAIGKNVWEQSEIKISMWSLLSFSLGPTGLTGQKGDTGPAGPPGPTAGGVVYTRWGRTTCPTTSGTQLVYTGRAAGSWYDQRGGGADYLCLSDNPNYLSYTNGIQDSRSYLEST